ncbi:hypothetical protein CYLTODRAFT_357962 [Cylindrobasidium torrendii FP15055 ss-10]|uniref:Geranylgeranyl pyrophosphate synthetase n=1 Tax=Cylindrobasidium torrendii FP15055 ss-10 TaxID=1314674 RepID=A0A0D7B3N9_9AGAR|nr:hypothetical protein CYLTODRAFT_357962 [Cylindrobasidium torrendii FP15055 ss-10]
MAYYYSSYPSFLTTGLEAKLKSLTPPAHGAEAATVSDVVPVASYSWIEGQTPTIAVPSSPPIWKSSTSPSRVPQDRGLTYIDQNSKRMEGHGSSLLPIFIAVNKMDAAFDYSNVDIVSDRNNLRKLLRWVTGSVDKDFRIDVDIVGSTCLFTRCEEKTTEYVTEFRGFGHEYEKAATCVPEGSKGMTGHHRIITMDLGGLKVMMRFEVDACLSVRGSSSKSSSLARQSKVKVISTPEESVVEQSSLIELKTRVAHKELDWADVYPQLYLSQTAFLYLAKHTRGVFAPPEKYALTGSKLKAHTTRTENHIGKLRQALGQIIKCVVAHKSAGGGGLFSLVCKDGQLGLYKREGGTKLDEEIISKFA